MEKSFIDYCHYIYSIATENSSFLLNGMLLTLSITAFAVVVGIIWGTILAIFRLSPYRVLRGFSKIYVNGFRSIPLVMVLLWFHLVIPGIMLSFLNLSSSTDMRLPSAIVAFALFESAYYSEIIRAGFQSIPRGQVSASLALGMTSWQSLKLVVMPQAFRTMIPLLLTQGIVLFQDVTLVYIMSLQDFFGSTQILADNYPDSTTGMILFAGAVYFIICFSASTLVKFFKKRIA